MRGGSKLVAIGRLRETPAWLEKRKQEKRDDRLRRKSEKEQSSKVGWFIDWWLIMVVALSAVPHENCEYYDDCSLDVDDDDDAND